MNILAPSSGFEIRSLCLTGHFWCWRKSHCSSPISTKGFWWCSKSPIWSSFYWKLSLCTNMNFTCNQSYSRGWWKITTCVQCMAIMIFEFYYSISINKKAIDRWSCTWTELKVVIRLLSIKKWGIRLNIVYIVSNTFKTSLIISFLVV